MEHLAKKEELFLKAKSVFSYLYGVILWTSTFPSPMQNPKYQEPPNIQPPPLGLKTLLYYSQLPNPPRQIPTTHPNSFVLHSHSIQSPSPSPSPPDAPSSLFQSNALLGDMIGTDSGVYVSSSVHKEQQEEEATTTARMKKKYQRSETRNKSKKYPPPIPLLARTGNLPGHMPWILTRHYENGRLTLTEERVKHHEYFEAKREDGRLILDLICLDNMVSCCHSCGTETEDEVELDEFSEGYGSEFEEEEGGAVDEAIKSASSSVPNLKSSLKEYWSERWGEGRKCLTYAGVNETSCNVDAHAQSDSGPLAFAVPTLAIVWGVV